MSAATNSQQLAADSHAWNGVLQMLATDPLAMDATLSLFAAAASSYRFDSILKPFPQAFLTPTTGHKDIERVRAALSLIPPLPVLRQSSSSFHREPGNRDAVELLCFLCHDPAPCLRSCAKEKFKELESSIGRVVHTVSPDFVMEVCWDCGTAASASAVAATRVPSSSDCQTVADGPTEGNSVSTSRARERQFVQHCQKFSHFMAYHGSRTENFHSILHNGLIAHLNKTALFGYGTYLSTALPVASTYSPNGKSWQHSHIGQELACVAVCDVADHPDHVKRSAEDPNASSSGTANAAAAAPTSATPSVRSRRKQTVAEDGSSDIPDKYIVVSNNDLVFVRYLLFYGHKRDTGKLPEKASWMRKVWQENQFVILMLFYALILVAVGLFRSGAFSSLL
eukprot:scpid68946/ scgid13069/ Poly [ADP-ribose] polymerase 16